MYTKMAFSRPSNSALLATRVSLMDTAFQCEWSKPNFDQYVDGPRKPSNFTEVSLSGMPARMSAIDEGVHLSRSAKTATSMVYTRIPFHRAAKRSMRMSMQPQ